MAFRAAVKLSLLILAAAEDPADQCKVRHNTTYANCWGDDLHGKPSNSFEECCQLCAEIPQCDVFTFDIWNISGAAEPYCFFKYGCSEPTHSDTAISGILHKSSTETTTASPKTSHASTTAPVTTEAPASSTTSGAQPEQPQCTFPEPVTVMGVTTAKQFNVSSWEECCSSCAPPACSYVTYGKYRGAPQETVACFHFAEPANVSAAHLGGTGFLMLRDDKAATCSDLGLEACAASPVAMGPPGPLPGPSASTPTAALAAVGVGSFVVTFPVGYFLSRKLGFGVK